MRLLELAAPAPPLATADTFNWGGEFIVLGQPLDESTAVRAGGATLYGGCGLHPFNQPNHVCATRRTQDEQAAWFAQETERLERRRLELAGMRIAAE